MQRTEVSKVFKYIVFLAVVVLPLLVNTSARAHKVTVFAYVEGGKVYTESYYADGTRCRNSNITVYDKQGHKVLTGKTNEKGEFSFTPPSEGPLKIVLDASPGHRAETVVSEGELLAGEAVAKASPQETKETQKHATCTVRPETGNITVSRKELKEILDETLDRKLRPVMKLLAESRQHGVSARDVFAGLGYIFGIMGIVIYVRDIKKQGEKGKDD